MATQDLIEQLTVQSDVIRRLIQEAEASVDEEQQFLCFTGRLATNATNSQGLFGHVKP